MHDLTSPRNRDHVTLELQVDNPAMIVQLRAAGDAEAQQVRGSRWLEIGFAACSYAGTIMDTSVVQQEFKQFLQALLHQFSLDNGDGILAHLVKLNQDGNGELVNNLDQRLRQIVGQLSLDDPTSAFSRIHGSLAGLLQTQNTTLSTGLAAFTTRRDVEAKSTLHGRTFQERMLAYGADYAGRRGHVFEDVSSRPGLIPPRCKTGDGLLTVGPDYFAKDAPIVLEAKDEKYSVREMLTEIEKARKNRGAPFGVFVIQATRAPDGMAPLVRYGDDIIVAWDYDNPASNICLDTALDMACGLATREAAAKDQSIDFTGLDRTINGIEKKAADLGQIFVSANTIRNAADKILADFKPKHAALIEELATLRDHTAMLRGSAGGPASDSIMPKSQPF